MPEQESDPVFDATRGRFRIRVKEFGGRASLTIYFRVSDTKTFTWHLNHKDLEALQGLIGPAGRKLQKLYLDTESKRRRY